MAEITRIELKSKFQTGSKPSQADFADVFDSFWNKRDLLDTNDNEIGSLRLSAGITVGNSGKETPGTIRFSGGKFQFRNNTTWEELGGGGAFLPISNGPNVAFNAGNVGINTGATVPAYRLEVPLSEVDSANPSTQVRFGQMVLFNSGTDAYLSHKDFTQKVSGNPVAYALGQSSAGTVIVNAPTGQAVLFTQANSAVAAVVAGTFLIGAGAIPGDLDLSTAGIQPPPLPSTVRLFVMGGARRQTNSANWDTVSDMRVKEAVAPFRDGLELLSKVEPIRFKYNGKAGTMANADGIGVSAQDIQKIFPYMVHKNEGKLDDPDPEPAEILSLDTSPLIYVLVNAIKELELRLKTIEQASHA